MYSARGLTPEPEASSNWYPQTPEDLHQLPGDSATCFHQTDTINNIPSILKKRVKGNGKWKKMQFSHKFGYEIRKEGKQLSTSLYRLWRRNNKKI
jgi:hypothetical protein